MKYDHETWSLELPESWVADLSEDCISFYSEDESRSLHISDYFKEDGHVTLDDIKELAEMETFQNTNLPFLHGFHNREIMEDEVILSWWLYLENHLIFAEYICMVEDEERRGQEIESLIYSIRSIHG